VFRIFVGVSVFGAFHGYRQVLDKLIGRGKFDEVKVGEWWGTKVAVKYLHNFDLKENAALFKKEISLMKELHHPHIVQFLGWSQEGALARGTPVIFMEYLSNGSVGNYLLLHGSRVGLSLRSRCGRFKWRRRSPFCTTASPTT
jgi:serine/threonine protein kinase